MARGETSCPNCGAPVSFKTSIAVMVVCEYCDTTVVRSDLDIESLGKMAKLVPDASPLYLGLDGCYKSRDFSIIGRLQLAHDAGAWNEWFIRFGENKTAWIGEAQGEYLMTQLVAQPREVAPMSKLRLGQRLPVGDRVYVVTDFRKARCVSGEGELPFAVGSGYEFFYCDLRSHSNRIATIDYSETPPLQFEGRFVEFDALGFTDPRGFNGWD